MNGCGRRPQLWQRGRLCVGHQDTADNERCVSREEALQQRMLGFSARREPKPLAEYMRNTLVVCQEFILCCLVLVRHRIAMQQEQGRARRSLLEEKEAQSMLAISLTFLVILVFNDRENNFPPTWKKTSSRTKDAVLLAALLRLISALLKTLTASYSSDTLYSLAIAGLMIHLLFCDYAYANGFVVPSPTTKDNGRLAFLGGTMSLNAALFSTVMLSSRLENNSTVFIFLSSSVILFCFYPAARNRISTSQPVFVTMLVTVGLMFATWVLLQSVRERALFVGVLLIFCFVAPAWKAWFLQHRKIHIHGPWDIAHIAIKE